jgi:NAD(P)-dependent dehydrogenase (short-subunit alcohol dehydrogenase family)
VPAIDDLARSRHVRLRLVNGRSLLGSYESLAAAQVALSNTLDAELSGSGVTAFTIGPGLVPTATASTAVERIAPKLGMSLDEFYTMNRDALLSVEAAGGQRLNSCGWPSPPSPDTRAAADRPR